MAMPFAAAFDRLSPRERVLVGALGGVLAAFLAFLVVFLVSGNLDGIQKENEEHAEVLREIARNRAAFRESLQAQAELERRYATKAPPLQSFLEEKATKRSLEIRDAQDKPEVQHGTDFVERSVQIRLNKVEIRSFVQLMEDVSTNRHPLAISKLRVRRRLAEPNSFDLDMTVSAYDRVGAPTPSKTKRPARRGRDRDRSGSTPTDETGATP